MPLTSQSVLLDEGASHASEIYGFWVIWILDDKGFFVAILVERKECPSSADTALKIITLILALACSTTLFSSLNFEQADDVT